MAEVKKVDKTAESTGFQNVGPKVVDTALRQASAHVPAEEAAAQLAMPSDAAVASYLETHPASKTFQDTRKERHEARKRGEPENNEAYPVAARDVEPSKKTKAEMDRGKKAQSEAVHLKDGSPLPQDVAARAAAEYNRNKAAEQQVERILGVEDAPPELKARPSEPPGVDTTEAGGYTEEKPHSGEKAGKK
jgi:hypothetical protein